MKNLIILTSFLAFLSCKSTGQKLKVSEILAKPQKVENKLLESRSTHVFTTFKEVTPRLSSSVFLIRKNTEELQFQIQGNINSSGHNSNKINKISFEKGEQSGNSVTLKYYVEIKKVSGKENNDVRGYNYTKIESYKIPKGVKLIKIELYENRNNVTAIDNPKLIVEQTFNFPQKI